ncbi:MAG: hypothetical protein PWR13_404 [Archaeoglobi archaeon]|nr:hypothetical protein [Archaeoglobi archaeon]
MPSLEFRGIEFKTPVAISSIAGVTDASFGNLLSDYVGAVFLGGFSIDERTIFASRKIASRGRKEFLFEDPIERIAEELEKVRGYVPAVNARASEKSSLLELAEICSQKNAILEINAHCRQKEIVEAGSGEALLKRAEILEEWIREIKKMDVIVSLKIRSGVVDEVALARKMEKAGLDILHVDAMGERGADLNAIRRIRNSTELFIIGNNSIRSFPDAKEMLARGADMVSLARAVLENPSVLREIHEGIEGQLSEMGWYNAPKHLCRGGDLRALAFCCPPFGECSLRRALKEVGISEERYILLKRSFAQLKGIEDDDITCFGNIVWCCKITKPCLRRDEALRRKEMSPRDYMEMKRELSEFLLRCLRNEGCDCC